MKVFEGQRTVLPRSSKNSSAASAEPVQLEVATAGSPFQAPQALLECLHERPVRPDAVVEDPVPERVQPLAVAVVEADGELVEFHVVGLSRVSEAACHGQRAISGTAGSGRMPNDI